VFRVGLDTVAALDVRDNIVNQVALECGCVVLVEAVRGAGRRMAVRHYDDHWDGLFLCDEIIDNHIGTADVCPGVFGIAASVQEEHYGECCAVVFAVIRRGVYEEAAGNTERFRLVGVNVEGAVRDRLGLEEHGLSAVDFHEALRGFPELDDGVYGVGDFE